jgi:hypothetical protein
MDARFRDHSTPEMARCRCSPISSTRIPSLRIDLSQPMERDEDGIYDTSYWAYTGRKAKVRILYCTFIFLTLQVPISE